MKQNIKRCIKCVLSENFPRIRFDEKGICNFCNDELLHTTDNSQIENAREDILRLFNEVKGKSDYDALICYSGGKDSTYTLKLAVEKYHLKVLSFTLDNGFISPTAFRNIEKVVSNLGVDHICYRPSYKFMKDLFRFSATEEIYNPRTMIRISANCNSCISIVNITAQKMAMEKGIPIILAGFTLGQIPSNTIFYRNNYEFFRESRQAILAKFRTGLGDDVRRYMEIPDSLLEKSASTYNVNLLTIEDITENEIVNQIINLGWVKPEDVDGCSTNCMINAFNNYVHEKRHGYSPYELELSHLIRKNLITREEALGKINDQPEAQISNIFNELKIDRSQIADQYHLK